MARDTHHLWKSPLKPLVFVGKYVRIGQKRKRMLRLVNPMKTSQYFTFDSAQDAADAGWKRLRV